MRDKTRPVVQAYTEKTPKSRTLYQRARKIFPSGVTHDGVTPDLALFAKVLAGGFPGGAVAGRADIMDVMTMRDDPEWNHAHRVPQQGTFNANPVSARAGLTTLKHIAAGDVIPRANRNGEQIRAAMNDAIRKQGLNWLVYGEFSGFHILPLPEGRTFSLADIYSGAVPRTVLKGGTPEGLIDRIRCGFLAEGVDVFPWPGGVVSAVHTDADIEQTAGAFGRLLTALKEDRQLLSLCE